MLIIIPEKNDLSFWEWTREADQKEATIYQENERTKSQYLNWRWKKDESKRKNERSEMVSA